MDSLGSQTETGSGTASQRKQSRNKTKNNNGSQRQFDTPKSMSRTLSIIHTQPEEHDEYEDSHIDYDDEESHSRDGTDNDINTDRSEEIAGDGCDLDTFLSKNIPAMATAAQVDKVTKKRTYVTKTNKEWTVDLKPLYKQLELMARKALLITCDKSLMQHCIDFCFADFTGVESQWIIDLAITRFRVNCNSWKSRYIQCVKSYIKRLEEKETVLKSVDTHKDLQLYFGERFSVDMFYTVCNWTYSWIDLEASIKEHPEVKVWCAYVFTEICVCVKRHLNWKRAYESGEQITKTQWDWQFILNRFDNLYTGADDTWEAFKIKQFDWLHNANRANRISLVREEKTILKPKDDEYALKPDPSFLAALQYAPKQTRPPILQQQTKASNGRQTTRHGYHKGLRRDESHTVTPRKRRTDHESAESHRTNSQPKKRRDVSSVTMSRNVDTDNLRSHELMAREMDRVNTMLKKRNYTSQSHGQPTTDERDDYDDDEHYENVENGADGFHDNNDDGIGNLTNDDNSTIDE
ncbi:hypothetical protein GGS21DRAFT_494251 [Xylaria nigripes]|nr:hypothetical protein GGS21DRAFT_494251 [Xylaria nigripes]